VEIRRPDREANYRSVSNADFFKRLHDVRIITGTNLLLWRTVAGTRPLLELCGD
jgi:hypothetical protein